MMLKADLPGDAGCRALSDEAGSRTASQYVSTLLEESDETCKCDLHEKQLSHSPSEWEHVLKEDLFLPGNPLK